MTRSHCEDLKYKTRRGPKENSDNESYNHEYSQLINLKLDISKTKVNPCPLMHRESRKIIAAAN